METERISFAKLKEIMKELDERKEANQEEVQYKLTHDQTAHESLKLSKDAEKTGNVSACTGWNCNDDVSGNYSACDAIWCKPPHK